MNRRLRAFALLIVFACCSAWAGGTPQSTAFTYQGNLVSNGVPANGLFDLVFTLYDAASGGAVVSAPITMAQFPVVNGKVVTDLDFPGVFAGEQRWLNVTVNGQALLPRQSVDTVPVAQYALATPVPAGFGVYEAHGTAQVQITTATTTYTLVPGLTINATVPEGAVVHLHTDGGVQSTGATASTYSVVDVALFVDGVVSTSGGQRRLSIANTSALAQLIANWSMDRTYTLGAGNHTFEVKAVGAAPGMATANVSSASAPQLQGTLSVEIVADSL